MDARGDNNDVLGIVAMLGMFFGMLLLFSIAGFFVRRAYMRRKQAIELRAPLLECVLANTCGCLEKTLLITNLPALVWTSSGRPSTAWTRH